MVFTAKYAAVAYSQNMYAGAAGHTEGGDDIHIAVTAFHALLVLHAAHQTDLVAVLRCLFELQVFRRLFHALAQLPGQVVAAAFEKQRGQAHVFRIFPGTDQPDAGRLAALDLVLQAGPAAVVIKTVAALAYLEGFLQQAQTFADGTGAGIGAEIASGAFLLPALHAQAGKFVVAEQYIGVGFVIAQQDVVGRTPLFDQVLLQQQGLGFAGGDGGFDLRDLADQCGCLG